VKEEKLIIQIEQSNSKIVKEEKLVNAIVITVDSVIQTQEEISQFTKDLVNDIQKHWIFDDVLLDITPGENENDFNLKIQLPEII
jgi:hypothetical protein